MTNNNPRYVTPTGVANYPWLVEPDTKFNPDGDYRVTMIFNEHTPELDYILQDLQKTLDNFYNETISDPKNAKVKSKITKADIFDEDDAGNVIMKFKQKAKIKSVKGTFDVKIAIFDSKGKPLKGVKLGSGSEIKLCFSVSPYYVPATRVCGLSLRPVAVQVIDLKEWGDPQNMKSYGFEEQEGYEEQDGDYDPPFEDTTAENISEDPIPSGDF